MVFKRQCESNQSQPIISINSDSVEWPKKWIWMLVWLARTVWAKTSSSHTIKSPNKLNPNTEKIELTTILIDVCGIVWHYCMHRYKPPLLPQRIKWEKKIEKKWPRCFAHTVDLCLSHQGPQFEKAISAGADHRGLLCWPRWEAGSEAQAAHSLVVRVLHRGVQLVAVTANTLSQIPGFTISGQPKGMPVPSLGNCAA